MSKIGTIQEIEHNGFKEMQGHVSTLHLNISFKLIRNPHKSGPNDPDYKIMTKSLNDHEAQIGAVWEKTRNTIGDVQDVFFSMTFDDPSFDHPLNVAAFKNNPGEWDIVWRRRQKQGNKATDAA